MEYRFLVEATKIENASILFKTALSEANVKTKWTYHKEWSFASSCLFFFGKFFPVLEPLKKSQFDVPTTQMSIFVFFVSARV